jgi:Protein of unknown function (DUF2934)
MNITPTKKTSTPVASDSQELQEKVRQRAYELYEARGRQHDHDLEK